MQKKRIPILIIFLALFAANCSRADTNRPTSTTQSPEQTSDVTLKTPEEAITYYLDGVAKNDIRKILQACAINEMSSNFKFDLYTARLNGMNLQYLSPSAYQFYVETNKTYLSSQILNQVKNLSFALLSGEKIDGSPIFPADAERANRFVKDVDPQKLSKLELKKISLPNKTVMNDAKYLENAAKTAKLFGADESTERVVLFSLEQNYYYLGFTLLRYGGNWKISSQNSPLASTDALGTPKKTTAEDFENMVSH
jgi:PBP1b-binding outer membrane lipoprotein LpoB